MIPETESYGETMRVGSSAGGSSLTVNDHMSCFFNQYIYKY